MIELLCTSCSSEKKHDAEPLPAIERYTSPRIRALARRARRRGAGLAILSGRYGLLDPATPIPWYDQALAPEEVSRLASKIAEQLEERGVTRLIFYARSASTPGWRPYHDVLDAACRTAGVGLEVRDAVGELVGTNPGLTARLFDLIERDEATRARLAADGSLFEGYAPEMEEVHRANAGELGEVLDRHGWPGRSLVGREAAAAAATVAQHAISLPDFQRRCLRILERPVEAGEAEPEHHARLVDRIRFNERRPQVYGTILDWDEDGRLSPWPIEEPQSVDERRRACGLPPLEQAVASLRRAAAAEGEAPRASFAERQRRIEEWCREVGWLPPAGV